MSDINYSAGLADATKQFLDKVEIDYDFDEEKGIFRFTMGLGKEHKMQSMGMFIRIHEDAISAYAVANVRADEDSIDAVAEYTTRANYGLRFGNFETDYRNGEVRYKCHNRFGDQIPSEEELAYITIGCGLMTWRHYESGFLKVLFGGMNPKDAIEEVENSAWVHEP